MNKRRIGIVFVLLLMLLFPVQVQAAKVKINKKKATVYVGKTVQLKVTRTKKKVKWSSSNKKIAKVTKKGKVKGIKVGKAVITAKVGTKKYKCKVTIKKQPIKSPIEVFFVDKNNITVQEEGYENVTFTYRLDGTITFNVADDKIVSCEWGPWEDEKTNLKIYGRNPGKTTITVSDSVKNKKIAINVTVASKYTEKERCAGIFIRYLKDRLLKDPTSLEVLNIYDAYNDVKQDDGTFEHHEFTVVEYLAKNGYGAKVRSYAELLLDSEPSPVGNSVYYIDGKRHVRWWEVSTYPTSVTMRGKLSIRKILAYSDRITFNN